MRNNSLRNLRILVTRPQAQAAGLMTILLEAGACPIPLPTIEIVGPPDSDPVYKAIAELSHYNWLILTSSNGVHHFFDYLKKQGLNHSNLAHLKTICVGPKTALAAKERGLKGGLVAQEYAAEGIIELFSSTDINEQRILLPRALKARETLPETLRAKGATVDVVPVYETIFPTESAYKLENILGSADIDLITITSASAATNLVKHCPSQHLTKLKALTTACIGPISAKVAAEVGLNVTIIANTYTSEGLLDAIRNYRI